MRLGIKAALAVLGLQAALAWGGETELLESAAQREFTVHNFGRARELYASLTVSHPENAEYWTWVGRLSGYLGDYAASISAYDRALQIAPGDVDTLVGKAHTLLWRRDYAGAASVLALAGQLEPESSDVAVANARMNFYQQRVGEALKYVQRALNLDPDNTDALKLKEQLLPHHTVRFETGFTKDMFSFAPAGAAGTVEAGWISPSDAISVRFESWNRFGRKTMRGGVRLSRTFNYHWILEGSALAGGRGDMVARHDDSIGLKRRFKSGWAVSGAYRNLLFDQSRVSLFSPSVEYSFERPISIQLSYYRAWTSYSGAAAQNPPVNSVLFRYNQRFAKAAVHAGLGRGTELFIAPSADRIGHFDATTWLAGADIPIAGRISAKAEYVLQRRSSGAFERTVMAGIVIQN